MGRVYGRGPRFDASTSDHLLIQANADEKGFLLGYIFLSWLHFFELERRLPLSTQCLGSSQHLRHRGLRNAPNVLHCSWGPGPGCLALDSVSLEIICQSRALYALIHRRTKRCQRLCSKECCGGWSIAWMSGMVLLPPIWTLYSGPSSGCTFNTRPGRNSKILFGPMTYN